MKNEKSRSSFETIKHSIQLQNVIYETATQWSLKWFHFQTSETRSHIGEVSFPSMKESVTNNMIDPCYNASQQRRSGRNKGKINEFIISFIMNFSFALHSRHRREKFVFFLLFFSVLLHWTWDRWMLMKLFVSWKQWKGKKVYLLHLHKRAMVIFNKDET